MSQTSALETTASEIAELQASVAQCLTEIDQFRELMNRDQAEIDRSRKRTHALLSELKAVLSEPSRRAA